MFFFTLLLSLLSGYFTPAPFPAVATTIADSGDNNPTTSQLQWAPDRRLTWEDFKAAPDSLNPHHALTAATLAVDARCSNNQFNYSVTSVFLPEESWTRNTASQKLLAHEQLHFDLTEVHARTLRKKLKAMGNNCPVSEKQLAETVNKAFADWQAEQDKFDHQSDHGLDETASEKWATTIATRLRQLQAYQ